MGKLSNLYRNYSLRNCNEYELIDRDKVLGKRSKFYNGCWKFYVREINRFDIKDSIFSEYANTKLTYKEMCIDKIIKLGVTITDEHNKTVSTDEINDWDKLCFVELIRSKTYKDSSPININYSCPDDPLMKYYYPFYNEWVFNPKEFGSPGDQITLYLPTIGKINKIKELTKYDLNMNTIIEFRLACLCKDEALLNEKYIETLKNKYTTIMKESRAFLYNVFDNIYPHPTNLTMNEVSETYLNDILYFGNSIK